MHWPGRHACVRVRCMRISVLRMRSGSRMHAGDRRTRLRIERSHHGRLRKV
jgi:hypothetical protein